MANPAGFDAEMSFMSSDGSGGGEGPDHAASRAPPLPPAPSLPAPGAAVASRAPYANGFGAPLELNGCVSDVRVLCSATLAACPDDQQPFSRTSMSISSPCRHGMRTCCRRCSDRCLHKCVRPVLDHLRCWSTPMLPQQLQVVTLRVRAFRYPHVNGRLAPASPPRLQASPAKRQLTRIRCVCGVTADRGRMIQCQVRVLTTVAALHQRRSLYKAGCPHAPFSVVLSNGFSAHSCIAPPTMSLLALWFKKQYRWFSAYVVRGAACSGRGLDEEHAALPPLSQ